VEDAAFVFVEQGAGEGALGGLVARHLVRIAGKLVSPLIVRPGKPRNRDSPGALSIGGKLDNGDSSRPFARRERPGSGHSRAAQPPESDSAQRASRASMALELRGGCDAD